MNLNIQAVAHTNRSHLENLHKSGRERARLDKLMLSVGLSSKSSSSIVVDGVGSDGQFSSSSNKNLD
jgi:hypothetical protein